MIPFLKWKENNADVPMEAMVWEDQFLRYATQQVCWIDLLVFRRHLLW